MAGKTSPRRASRASAKPHRQGYVFAGTVDALAAKGKIVVRGRRSPILVVWERGAVYALDNRCPHLGFPLHRGSVEDGILTCHWHHARFDVTSGCTFDLWADDIPTADVEIANGEVWVADECTRPDEAAHWLRKLRDGMEHNIALVIGKAVLGARTAGVEPASLVGEAARFGTRYRDGWGTGLTVLAALANLLPYLPEDEAYLALFHGIRRVAADCAGRAPRRDRRALEGAAVDADALERWLRHWILVRHRDGAERTLATAIEAEIAPERVARMLLNATTDRTFADGGHALDFVNKASECLDVIGWEHAAAVLPSVVAGIAAARGGEEMDSWRHPVDLVPLLESAFAKLPERAARGARAKTRYRKHAALSRALLGDDAGGIGAAVDAALEEGAGPVDLGRALAHAAATRIARFGRANEFSDWDSAHHSFTYCNALHQTLKRAAGGGTEFDEGAQAGVRGVYHGAMTLYLNRYLNVPPAPLPGERGRSLDTLPDRADRLLRALLDAFDRKGEGETAAGLVARYLRLGHPHDRLIATLAHAVLREDADFHAYQMLEAAARQFGDANGGPRAHVFLIAAARFLAARFPTERAQGQTAAIARRLHRGGRIHTDIAGAEPSAAGA